jgi:hypothetical protein
MPETERQLQILQDSFFVNYDEKYLNKMYHILVKYSKSLFLKTFKNVSLCDDDIQYYSENAVSIFIVEYYYEKKIKINVSFGGMMILKLKQTVYGKMESNIDAISIDYKFIDDHNIQYEDNKSYSDLIEEECDRILLTNTLYDIIVEVSNYSDSPLENYMREQALLLHFTKGERYADKLFKLYNKEGKIIYTYTLDILRRQLKKSIEIS